MTALHELAESWRQWSRDADKEEAGWQTDFPEWSRLLAAAQRAMVGPFDETALPDLELVWEASEESEEMLEFSANERGTTDHWLPRLVLSSRPAVRWQVYESLRQADKAQWAHTILRDGLRDADNYARRRAVIALEARGVEDIGELSLRLTSDPDPYVRRIAVAMAIKSKSPELLRTVLSQLGDDPEELVRTAIAEASRLPAQ